MKMRMHMGNGSMVSSMLLEGHCDLGISAYPVIDSRLKSELIYTSRLLPIASPQVVARFTLASDFALAIRSEPLLAYNLELSLVDSWLQKNQISIEGLVPATVGQDLRAQRKSLSQGVGWSVMPEFLCKEHILSGQLMEIPSPVGTHDIQYFLIWLPSALRHVRVAHARQALLSPLVGFFDGSSSFCLFPK